MNDDIMLEKLEQLDPLLARSRRWMRYCQASGMDVADCIEEVLQNIHLGREWARKGSTENQHLEGRIEIRISKKGLRVKKDFRVVHPMSSYHQSGIVDKTNKG